MMTRRSARAGELLAQRGERLVAGEGAAGVRVGRSVRGVGRRRLRRSLDLSLSCRRDLLAVRLEARLRLGVLALPLLLLSLVPGKPVVGLRVEALGVDVVALVVVRRGHAVEGRVERVALRLAGLVGLLERQRDAPTLEVDVD